MELRYFSIINILLALFLTVLPTFYLTIKLRLNIINPLSILLLFALPIKIVQLFVGPYVILEDALNDPGYNFSILMENIALALQLTFTVIAFKIVISYRRQFLSLSYLAFPPFKLRPLRMIRFSFFLFLCSFVSLLLVASHSFGIVQWLLDPRAGYIVGRSGAGQYYALSILFMSVGLVISTLFVKRFSSTALLWALAMSFAWLAASKGIMLAFTTYFLILMWWRFPKWLYPSIFLAVPATMLFVLINFGAQDVAHVINYFDYYVHSANYYKEYFSGGIDLYYGKILFTSYWEYLPRSLFYDKPYVYGTLLLNEHFFPGMAEQGHTPAFGGPIGAFADFGVLGVVASNLFSTQILLNILGLVIVFYGERRCNEIVYSDRLIWFIVLFGPVLFIYFPPVLSFLLALTIYRLMWFANSVFLR